MSDRVPRRASRPSASPQSVHPAKEADPAPPSAESPESLPAREAAAVEPATPEPRGLEADAVPTESDAPEAEVRETTEPVVSDPDAPPPADEPADSVVQSTPAEEPVAAVAADAEAAAQDAPAAEDPGPGASSAAEEPVPAVDANADPATPATTTAAPVAGTRRAIRSAARPVRAARPARTKRPVRTKRPERAARPVRPAGTRRAAGRIVLAAATVLALGGTVAASSLLTLPRVDAAPVAASVTPSADGLRLACAGPLLQLTEAAAGESAALTAVGTPVFAAGATVELTERPLTAELAGTTNRGFALESSPDPAGAAVLGAAAQSQYGAAGLVGLVASACPAPSASAWLVGGSTELGRTTLVNLLNPTDVAATVDLTILGEEGPVRPPGASGIAVPAGEQVVVPLSGLAPDLASPVVHVESRGGQVVAALQQSIVRGIDPGGVDTFGPTATPATRQYIPGVRVANGAALLERMSAEGYADLQSVVRVFVPGDEHTEVRIGVVADDPQGTGSSLSFHIEPDQVVDVPLEALADGSYTVTIDADLPVVAAVRQSQLGAAGETDLAWLPAAEALPAGVDAWVSVTPGPGPRLFLHNPGTGRVSGTLTAVDGTVIPVAVDPGATTVVPVTRRQTYRLNADGDLRGAVSYLRDGAVAGYPVLPPPAAAEPITVYPG